MTTRNDTSLVLFWIGMGLITISVLVAVAIEWSQHSSQGTQTQTIVLVPAASRPAPGSALSSCQTEGRSCGSYLLSLINQERAQFGQPALVPSSTIASGTPGCSGATHHAYVMGLKSPYLWHTNPSYPEASFSNDVCGGTGYLGQNVGECPAPYFSWYSCINQDFQQMMAEPHDAATCAQGYNHACNLLSPHYKHIGIGLKTTTSTDGGGNHHGIVESFSS